MRSHLSRMYLMMASVIACVRAIRREESQQNREIAVVLERLVGESMWEEIEKLEIWLGMGTGRT